MATISLQVNASGNDAHQAGNSTSAVISNATDTIGTSATADSPPEIYAVRFLNVTIPKESHISQNQIAQLQLCSNADFITINGTWYGEAADNSAIFTAGENLNSRSRTVATVNLSENISRTAGVFYGYPTTGNWASIVQEIVNRPGWVSGNAISFLCLGTTQQASAHGAVRNFDTSAGSGATLNLEYTPPFDHGTYVYSMQGFQ